MGARGRPRGRAEDEAAPQVEPGLARRRSRTARSSSRHFGSEGLYAYDLRRASCSGSKDLGVLNAGWFYDPDYEWGVASSPILWKDLVIVQCDIQKGSFVAAYRAKDGEPAWRTERDEIPSWPTPDGRRGSTARPSS